MLVIVMPATNNTFEWSFSALRRVKTCIRSKQEVKQSHYFTCRTDKLDEDTVANEFVCELGHRLRLFGNVYKN